MKPTAETADSTDFSLVLGGPLYQFFLRSGLLKSPLDLLRRRVLSLTLLTWLPLLILSALEGQALAGVRLPFVQDLEAQARFLLGQSVIVSAMIAGRILNEGARLPAFKNEIVGALVFALLQALGPLLVFIPNLVAAKRRGLREYSLLADRYVGEFDRKWIRGGAAPDEALVGSADIQSLADLGSSFAVVREMRAVPFGKETILQLVIVTALPLLPLALTMFPLDELIRRMLGVLL